MMNQRIEIKAKIIYTLLAIMLGAFIFTYGIEHFCEVDTYWADTNGKIGGQRASRIEMETLLGNKIVHNIRKYDIEPRIDKNLVIHYKAPYMYRIPLYIKAALSDIIIPILILIGYLAYLVFNRFFVIKK